MTDNVNHPSHYNSHPSGVECIEVSEELTPNLAQAYQYVFRAGLKPDVEERRDLRAGRWFVRREMKRPSNHPSVVAMRHCIRKSSPPMELARKVAAAEPDETKACALRFIAYSVDDLMNYYKPLAIEAISKMLYRLETPEQREARAEMGTWCFANRVRLEFRPDGTHFRPDSAQPSLILPDDDPIADFQALKDWYQPNYRVNR